MSSFAVIYHGGFTASFFTFRAKQNRHCRDKNRGLGLALCSHICTNMAFVGMRATTVRWNSYKTPVQACKAVAAKHCRSVGREALQSFHCGDLCGETKKGSSGHSAAVLDHESAYSSQAPPPRVGSKLYSATDPLGNYWAPSFHCKASNQSGKFSRPCPQKNKVHASTARDETQA